MSINLLSSYQYFSVAHPLEEANTFYMARLLQIDVKYVAKFAFVRGNLSKRVFCRKTHRFLPLYVLGNRSKTLLLPIICKSTDLPTASRLRSEGTSLKSHRLNIYNGIVPSNANIPDPIREPPAPIAKSFNTFSDFFIRPSSSFLSKASSVFWIILFTFSVLSPNVC